MASHQEDEYKSLQANRPCCYREELKLKTKHVPASPCCKAKDLIIESSFNCKLLNKKIVNCSICWACQQRQTDNCN